MLQQVAAYVLVALAAIYVCATLVRRLRKGPPTSCDACTEANCPFKGQQTACRRKK